MLGLDLGVEGGGPELLTLQGPCLPRALVARHQGSRVAGVRLVEVLTIGARTHGDWLPLKGKGKGIKMFVLSLSYLDLTDLGLSNISN